MSQVDWTQVGMGTGGTRRGQDILGEMTGTGEYAMQPTRVTLAKTPVNGGHKAWSDLPL